MILENNIQKWKLVKIQILGPYGVINHYTHKSIFTIGKSELADVQVNFKFIEDIHIQVEIKSNKRIYITDLATERGSYIARKKVESQKPTKYLLGSEVGFAGLTQAVIISLLNDAENEKSEGTLKLVEANLLYDNAELRTQASLKENEKYIKEIRELAVNEVQNDKLKMDSELDELRIQSEHYINLQKENEDKSFQKLKKKNLKQIFKLENKTKDAKLLLNDLKRESLDLEKDKIYQLKDLEQRRVFLIEINKKIDLLKESFETDKEKLLDYLSQLEKKKDIKNSAYKKQHDELEGQIITLKNKKSDLKNKIEKGKSSLKIKVREIRDIEKKLSDSKKEIQEIKDEMKATLKEISKIKASSSEIIDKAKDEALQIINKTNNDSQKAIQGIISLSSQQSEAIINQAKINADEILHSALEKSSKIETEKVNQIQAIDDEYEERTNKLRAIEEKMAKKEEESINLTKSFHDREEKLEQKLVEKLKDINTKNDKKLSSIEMLRGQMTYKFEQEKKQLQEKLDRLNLDYIEASTKITFKNFLKYFIPSLVTLILTLTVSHLIVKDETTRDLASKTNHSYLTYEDVLEPKIISDIIFKINNVLTRDLSLVQEKVQKIKTIEQALLDKALDQALTGDQFRELEIRENKKIKEILKHNWNFYQNKKYILLKEL